MEPVNRTIRANTQLQLLDRLALGLLFLFLLGDVLGGAIRYYAVQFHIPWVSYVPYVLLACSLVPMFFVYLVSEGVTSTYLQVVVLFGIATTWGAFNLGRSDQIGFGLWVCVAFFYGIVLLPAIMRGWRSLTPYVFFLWALAVAGVFINFFYSWPWIGLRYQVGATVIEASRRWTAGALSFSRLPGFSRASFDVSLQILIPCIFLAGALRRRWWIPVWVLSAAAIALTTDKTVAAIFILLSIGGALHRKPLRPFWRYLPLTLAALDILLPFSMLLIKIDWMDALRSHLWIGLFASFLARMQVGWPEWLRMIAERGNWFLGRGMGGIGTPQLYFEPTLYSSADNIAVYLYGVFGIPGLALLLVYAWNVTRSLGDSLGARFLFLCSCVVLLEGATSNVMEAPLLALALGLTLRYFQTASVRALSYVFKPKKQVQGPVTSGNSQPQCT